MTAVDGQWQWMKWPLHLIVFPPGEGRQGRRLQEHSNEDLWQMGRRQNKTPKGMALKSHSQCNIHCSCNWVCWWSTEKKGWGGTAVFKLWLYSLLIFNIIRKSLENHHKTWDYDQSIKHNDYSVYSFSALPWKWDLQCCGYVEESMNIFHNYCNIWKTLACMNYYNIMKLCLSAQKQSFHWSLYGISLMHFHGGISGNNAGYFIKF